MGFDWKHLLVDVENNILEYLYNHKLKIPIETLQYLI